MSFALSSWSWSSIHSKPTLCPSSPFDCPCWTQQKSLTCQTSASIHEALHGSTDTHYIRKEVHMDVLDSGKVVCLETNRSVTQEKALAFVTVVITHYRFLENRNQRVQFHSPPVYLPRHCCVFSNCIVFFIYFSVYDL